MKFDLLIEYNMRNLFLEKPYTILDFESGERPRYPSQPKIETGIPQVSVPWNKKFGLGLTPSK